MLFAFSLTLACSADGRAGRLNSLRIDGRRIEDPTGKALAGLCSALSDSGNSGGESVTRILHFGDSHVASDLLTGSLRRQFQIDFGDAGAGFVSLASPGYQTPMVTRSATDGWLVRRPEAGPLCACGLVGPGLSARQPAERVWLTAHCLSFDVYLLAQPGGGTVDLLLDGEIYESGVDLNSRVVEAAYVPIECPDDSLHSLEIRIASVGLVTVLGVVTERSGPGVVYDALGVNGARATNLLAWDAGVLASNLKRRGPDLIIVTYGSNEVTDADLDLKKYRSEFLEILLRFRRAAPRAALLVVSPPDRAVRSRGRWVTAPAMPGLVTAQRLAAFEAGAAFWDLFEAMGGSGSIERWATRRDHFAQPDRVHLTRAGYRAVADALYRELRRVYAAATLKSGGPVR
jgi:lysophospholipase L1-like esterase